MVQSSVRGTSKRRVTWKVVGLVGLMLAAWFVFVWGQGKADATPTCTKTFTGASGGLYQTASNWTPSGIPGASDYACADASKSIVYSSASQRVVKGINFAGSFTISTSELRIGTTTAFDDSFVKNLTVNSTRGGRAPLYIAGSLTMNSGAMLGTPYATSVARGGRTVLSAGATFDLTADLNLQGDHVFRNEGSVTYSNGSVWQYERSNVENAGTWVLPAALQQPGFGSITAGQPANRFTNVAGGVLTKSATGTYASINTPFENDGTVNVTGDDLYVGRQFAATDTDAGQWTIASASNLFLTDNRKLTTGASVSGAGTLALSGGTIDLGPVTAITNLQLVGSTVNGSPTVSGNLDWQYGTLDGAGTLTIAPAATATIDVSATHYLDNGYRFKNRGTTTWSLGHIQTCNGAVLENAGQFLVTDTGGYSEYSYCGTPYGSFVNDAGATLTKDASVATEYMYQVENHGAIVVNGGTLYLGDEPTTSAGDNGSIAVVAGAQVQLGGNRTFVSGATVTGAGTVNASGGSVNFGPVTALPNLVLSGATISGSMDVSSTLDWQAGTMSGAGTLTVKPAATATISTSSSHYLDNGYRFKNQGTTTWSVGYVQNCNGSVFENAGQVTITDTGGYAFYGSCGDPYGSFVNDAGATVTKDASTANEYVYQFENHGAVVVNGGSLHLGAQPTTSTGDNGSITVAAGAVVSLDDTRSFATGATVSGAGAVQVAGGTIDFGPVTSLSNLVLAAGTVSGNMTVSGSLDWQGAYATGTGTLTVGPAATATIGTTSSHQLDNGYKFKNLGATTWATGYIYICDGSTFENAGQLTITDNDGYSILECGTSPNLFLNDAGATVSKTLGALNYVQAPMQNLGTVSVSTGRSLRITSDLSNLASGVLTGGTYVVSGELDIDEAAGGITTNAASLTLNGSGIVGDSTGTSVLGTLATNSGTFNLNRNLTVSSPFANSGSVTIGASSTLTVPNTGDYVQTGGTTALPVSTSVLKVNGATRKAVFTGGTLTGVGTVQASIVQNAAEVRPGSSPGVLSISGAYTQTSAGTLTADLNGTTVGTGYDRLAVTGAVTLDGTLNLVTGYAPAAGDSFTVVTGASSSGTFAAVNGLHPGGSPPKVFAVGYDPADVTVTTAIDVSPSTLSIDDVTHAEGNTGSTTFSFTVTRSGATTSSSTVHFATGDGTAIAPGDYGSTSGDMTFAVGETAKTVDVAVVGDTVVEPDESFSVNLSASTGASIADSQGVGTISNDDAVAAGPASLAIADTTIMETDSGSQPAAVVVTLSSPQSTPVTVKYATANSTATTPDDYTAIPSTLLTFAPGETAKIVPVAIVGDEVAEKAEKLSVKLSAATGASIADTSAYVNVVDNDAPIAIYAANAVATEGNASTTNLGYVLSLSRPVPAGQSASVTVATSGGTATAGTDYVAVTATTVTFGAGEQTKTVDVAVNGDTATEPNETLNLTVTMPVGAVVADTSALGTIVNDDGTPTAPPLPSITIGDVSQVEGDTGTQTANVPVTLSAPQAAPVTVKYATAKSTAIAPDDFTTIPISTLTFAPGETTKVVPVAIVGDTLAEKAEKLSVKLSSPTGATIADTTATVNIFDNDAPIVLYVENATATEGNSGTTNLAYVVSLSSPAPTGQSVTVKVATSGGTATAGTDYATLATTMVTFAPGEQTKPVNVTVNGDTAVEKSETVNLTVKMPTGAVIGDTAAVGTIVNDD